MTRLRGRYPMASQYYRMLFSGDLGYRPVAEFTAYPQIGGLTLRDDNADESFTVYDHPRVLVFENVDRLKPELLRARLGRYLPDGAQGNSAEPGAVAGQDDASINVSSHHTTSPWSRTLCAEVSAPASTGRAAVGLTAAGSFLKLAGLAADSAAATAGACSRRAADALAAGGHSAGRGRFPVERGRERVDAAGGAAVVAGHEPIRVAGLAVALPVIGRAALIAATAWHGLQAGCSSAGSIGWVSAWGYGRTASARSPL